MVDGHDTPPKVAPRVKAAPKIRQVYWCDFPKDAQLPEFWKVRPVIILSYRNALGGAVTIVPCSTHSQPQNPWAVALETSLDGKEQSWAIADKISTVAVSRLSPFKDMIRLGEDEFNRVLRKVLDWLPQP